MDNNFNNFGNNVIIIFFVIDMDYNNSFFDEGNNIL